MTGTYEANIRRCGNDDWKVLECIRARPGGVTLAEAAAMAGVGMDAARGIVHRLSANGMVRRMSRTNGVTTWGAKRWWR